MAARTTDRRITRDDLEAAFSEVVGEGEADRPRRRAPGCSLIAGAVAMGVVAVAYLAGRRRGRRRSTFLEIRRF